MVFFVFFFSRGANIYKYNNIQQYKYANIYIVESKSVFSSFLFENISLTTVLESHLGYSKFCKGSFGIRQFMERQIYKKPE